MAIENGHMTNISSMLRFRTRGCWRSVKILFLAVGYDYMDAKVGANFAPMYADTRDLVVNLTIELEYAVFRTNLSSSRYSTNFWCSAKILRNTLMALMAMEEQKFV